MSVDAWQWYTPTQVELACSDQTHWVRWEKGQLVPLNHSQGEQTLAALAGENPACFELIQLWNRHNDDLRVLALASRGPNDPLLPHPQAQAAIGRAQPLMAVRPSPPVAMPPSAVALPGRPAPRAVPGLATAVASMRPGRPATVPAMVEDPVARLLTLAGPLADRLVATVARAWAERLRTGHAEAIQHQAALTAALYGSTTSALRIWLGAPGLVAEVTMITEEQAPAISRDDQAVKVSLPFSWIPDVYSRGLSVLLGHFVLRVAQATATEIVLDAVGTDLNTTKLISISL